MLKVEFYSLGTMNTIYTLKDDTKKIVNKVIKRVEAIDDKMSIFKNDSEVSLISKNSGLHHVKVSEETFNLLVLAKKYAKLTGGMYDITIAPLSKLYNFKKDEIPSDLEIKKTKKLVDYHKLHLNKFNKTVYLTKKGMAIDLGSIAKGYGVDEAVRILKENGVKDALINFGGDVYALGNDEYGKFWNIGIQNPLKNRGVSFLNLDVENKAVVTSSVNEQFIIKDSKFYHHIINPKTGYPLDLSLLSVTIIDESSTLADVLSTASFLIGLNNATELVKKVNSRAVFIDKDQFVFSTFDVKEKA
jgi:thiamine biosynthesis lipoprotein